MKYIDTLALAAATDVTVGIWMAAFNVTYFDDRRLCAEACTGTSVVLHDVDMCTSCDPRPFLEHHKSNRMCSSTTAVDSEHSIYMPTLLLVLSTVQSV